MSYELVEQTSEFLLVQKVLQGNANAYAPLVEKYQDAAVGLAYNILLNRQDAEEAAQDAFVKAYRALASFKAESKFSTWLYRIIVNTALNKKKQTKNRSSLWEKFVGSNKTQGHYSDKDRSTTNSDKQAITNALQLLTDNERICISLFYLEELSVEEIHTVTALSVSNIKVLLYRGRKSLHTSLQALLKDEIKDLL